MEIRPNMHTASPSNTVDPVSVPPTLLVLFPSNKRLSYGMCGGVEDWSKGGDDDDDDRRLATRRLGEAKEALFHQSYLYPSGFSTVHVREIAGQLFSDSI